MITDTPTIHTEKSPTATLYPALYTGACEAGQIRLGAQALNVYAMVLRLPVTMARDSADSDRISLAHAKRIAPMGVTVKLRKNPANLAELVAGHIES